MRNDAGNQNDINGSVTHGLICDIDLAADRVSRGRQYEITHWPAPCLCNPRRPLGKMASIYAQYQLVRKTMARSSKQQLIVGLVAGTLQNTGLESRSNVRLGSEELVEKIIHRCVGRTAAIKASIKRRETRE